MDNLNLEATAKAMLEQAEEYKTCKRNKSGTLNGNAAGAIRTRCAVKLQEAGWTRSDAWSMVWDLDRKQK